MEQPQFVPNPYYQQPAPPPPQLTAEQKRDILVNKVRALRTDLTQAYNPYSLQKVLDGTLQVIEFVLTGQVTNVNPNQVPGQAVNPLDSGKVRVEFFSGPGVAPPSAPVNSSDVQFVPAPPQQLLSAPDGSAVQSYERNGQKVEFYPNPPGTPVTGQLQQPQPQYQQPQYQQPQYQPQSTLNNPPSATFAPQNAPMIQVEAGQHIPAAALPAPAQGMPVAAPFAEVMPAPAPGTRVAQRVPQSREELMAMLPIPSSQPTSR